MLSAKLNIWVVIFILLMQVSQVMSAVVNMCQNAPISINRDIKVTMVAEHNIHTSVHSIERAQIEKNDESCICCDLNCFCPMGSCVSIAVSTVPNQTDAAYLFNKIERLPQLAISQTIPTLLRPPIS